MIVQTTPDLIDRSIAWFERVFDPQDWKATHDGYKAWVTELTGVTPQEYRRDLDYVARHCTDDPRLVAFAEHYIEHLSPFLQGPVLLPGGTVAQSAWDVRFKGRVFDACGVSPEVVAGKRVIDIGCNAGFDTMQLASMGAAETLGVEPWGFYYQACFLKVLYQQHDVSFLKCGWQDLTDRVLGKFDVVNCQGLIYHEKNPVGLLERVRSLLAPDGLLILETHALAEVASRDLYFVEESFWSDNSYWFIFGEEAILGLLRRLGFRDVRLVANTPCHSRNAADSRRTVEGHPAGARLVCTARL